MLINLIVLQASDNGTTLGVAVLQNFEVFPDKNWFWIGSAALLGFAILLNILYTFALMYLSRKNQHSFLMSNMEWNFIIYISGDYFPCSCLNSSRKNTSYNI